MAGFPERERIGTGSLCERMRRRRQLWLLEGFIKDWNSRNSIR